MLLIIDGIDAVAVSSHPGHVQTVLRVGDDLIQTSASDVSLTYPRVKVEEKRAREKV